MTGYQEVLTDPSYRGQIVAMTYPLVGNYGVNFLDVESAAPQVRGFVIEELSPLASNWRSQGTLHEFLLEHDIPGIEGIDTRALTRRLRQAGAMRACIAMEDVSDEKAVSFAKAVPYEGVDFVQEVTHALPVRLGRREPRKPKMASFRQRSPTAVAGRCRESLRRAASRLAPDRRLRFRVEEKHPALAAPKWICRAESSRHPRLPPRSLP